MSKVLSGHGFDSVHHDRGVSLIQRADSIFDMILKEYTEQWGWDAGLSPVYLGQTQVTLRNTCARQGDFINDEEVVIKLF